MIYALIYFIIGILTAYCSWMYKTRKKSKTVVPEGSILVFLPACIIFWPAVWIGLFIDFVHFINKEYLK